MALLSMLCCMTRTLLLQLLLLLPLKALFTMQGRVLLGLKMLSCYRLLLLLCRHRTLYSHLGTCNRLLLHMLCLLHCSQGPRTSSTRHSMLLLLSLLLMIVSLLTRLLLLLLRRLLLLP